MEKMESRLKLNRIARAIIGCAYEVGKHLRFGYLEKVYENALAHEIRLAGLKAQQQQGIKVRYKAIVVGDYTADLLVENCVLVELKTAKAIEDAHIAQCLNYLAATDLRICLLVNFGEAKIEFKRLVHHF